MASAYWMKQKLHANNMIKNECHKKARMISPGFFYLNDSFNTLIDKNDTEINSLLWLNPFAT